MTTFKENLETAAEQAAGWLPHAENCEVRPERDCTCWLPRVEIMRAALEDVVPNMLAKAWEEGFQKGVEFCEWNGGLDSYKPDFTNPYTAAAQVDGL